MANPLTADQQLATVKAFAARHGITVREYPGWRDRGMWRSRDRGFQPIGITIHQTAGGLGRRSVESYIRDIIVSDRAVPDKSQAVIAPNGDIWMVGAGRCNHTLYYGSKALTATRAASFPLTGNANYRGSNQNWNYFAYGVECIGSGILPEVQRRSAVVWAAALAHAHGWTGQETHGHGEVAYDRGWSDPGWNMGQFRRDVMATVKGTLAVGAGAPSNKTDLERLLDNMDENKLREMIRDESEAGANAALWTPPIKGNKSNWGASLKDSIARSAYNTTQILAGQAGLRAAIVELAKGVGDPAAIGKAVEDAMNRSFSKLEADVNLTINKES